MRIDDNFFEEISDAIDRDDGSLTGVIQAVLSGSSVRAMHETTAFLKRLLTEETPDTEEEIMAMSKDEIVQTIFRVNFFEKVRYPVLDDQQIEHLYDRVVELWGEAPTEPIGRWAEWNLWVTRHRRRNGISITEVIAGDQTVDDVRQSWVERHEERERRRKLHKMVNYEQYNVPEDIPPSIRELLFSPFVENPEQVPADVDSSSASVTIAEQDTATEKES